MGPLSHPIIFAVKKKKMRTKNNVKQLNHFMIANCNYKANIDNNNNRKSVSFSGQFGNFLSVLIFTLRICVIYFGVI